MYVNRPGAKIFYQVTGAGPRDLVLVPACYPMVYSRVFKAVLPYLSRYFRVVTLDFRGNGRSDRPRTGYDADTMYGDLAAVLEIARPPSRWPRCPARTC
jgi:pimeloyl-ACP methyl ester carboxylesterase